MLLPPGPEPKKLTAKYQIVGFKDRLSAFLAVNNINGFIIDKEPENSPVIEFLLNFSKYNQMQYEKFKRQGADLKKLCNGAVRHTNCLELLAAVWGYKALRDLQLNMKGNTVFNNEKSPN